MGAIYSAIQEPLGRKVAVKILVPGEGGVDLRGIDQQRFFREASVASRLTHPNTVVIHDYGALEDRPGFFLVMEFLEGGTLADAIKRGPMRVSRVVHIATQVCGALAEAHAADVVHRDLKPQNIMLVDRAGDPDYVKVVDFGLVKMTDPGADESAGEQTEEGIIIGSPLYMAPEQIFAGEVDQRTDVYALGVVLYECLMGRPPFIKRPGGRGLEGIIMGHTTLRPPAFIEANPDVEVNPRVEDAILKCLEKDRNNRHPTARHLADELIEASTDLSESARLRASSTLNWTAGLALKAKVAELENSGELGKASAVETAAFHRADFGPVSTGEVQPAATSPLEADSVLPLAYSAEEPPPPDPTAAVSKPRTVSLLWIAAAVAVLVVALIAWSPWKSSGALGDGDGSPNNTGNVVPTGADKTGPATAPADTAKPAAPDAGAAAEKTDSPAAAPAEITVHFECEPRARIVDLQGKDFGETPGPVKLKRSQLPYTFEFRRARYITAERQVTKEMVDDRGAVSLSLTLEAVPSDPASGPDSKSPDASAAPPTPRAPPKDSKKGSAKKKKKKAQPTIKMKR